jgi:MFS family permease
VIGVLANRTFRRLFAAQVVALVGTGLLTVALALLAYDVAGDDAGAVLGTALAIKMAAYVLVAPVTSALTHRLPRTAVLVGSDVVRGAVALCLPFVDQTWQIYVAIFVLQAASATFTPTFQAIIPTVLDDEADYTRGLSLSRLAYDLESLVSPILAAALLTVVAFGNLFVATAVGFAASALLVATTALPHSPAPKMAESFWRRTTLGARIMFDRPVLRALLALNLAVACATALVVVNTVVYVTERLGGPSSAVALLMACYGAGSMIVALAVPRLLRRSTDRRVMVTGAVVIPAVLVATTVVLAMPVAPPPAGWTCFASAWFLLGASTSLVNTPSARLLRAESDTSNRASVFTAQFSLSHACFFVTYPLAGWAGATLGQPVAAAALALLAAVGTWIAARAWQRPPTADGAPSSAGTAPYACLN